MRPATGALPALISRIPLAIALRDNPRARRTSDTPSYPKLSASLAAVMRRVRSSKCGQMKRNFRFNSSTPLMPARHDSLIFYMIPFNQRILSGPPQRWSSAATIELISPR
jgi:hypothetical protein